MRYFDTRVLVVLVILLFSSMSYASVHKGGLTLLQPREITIERQDVSITPNEVTISYVFRNNFALDFFHFKVIQWCVWVTHLRRHLHGWRTH